MHWLEYIQQVVGTAGTEKGNTMRLIDADELRKDIVERGTQLSGCYSAGIARYMDRMLANVLADVDISPTVDAVPVVRCKDCKHCNTDWAMGKWYGSCKIWNTHSVMDDWYCVNGERKGDE